MPVSRITKNDDAVVMAGAQLSLEYLRLNRSANCGEVQLSALKA